MIQRLKSIFKQETIQMTFLGGSVTEGYPYDERVSMPYPEIVSGLLQKRYPDKTIRMSNLAGCGEQSTHGLFKCETALDQTQKQIVFLEYALNDDASQTFVKVFESLVRKLLKMPGEVAVAVIILPSAKSKNTAMGEYMRTICAYYKLLCLDVAEYVKEKKDIERPFWDKYSFDQIHPGQWGHEMIAHYIVKEIEKKLGETSWEKISYARLSKPYFSSPYENMRVIEPDETAGFPMSFEVECFAVWLIYIKHNESFMGTLQVYVDGEFLCNLHGKSFYCWKYPAQTILWEKEQPQKHTITFRMAPGEKQKKFYLKYIGIC